MESIGIKRRITNMLILVLAGEIIFGLPFHLARFFRPTYLDVFNISNTNLGDVYAVYGLTAMIFLSPPYLSLAVFLLFMGTGVLRQFFYSGLQ
jgi:hypothetical protein